MSDAGLSPVLNLLIWKDLDFYFLKDTLDFMQIHADKQIIREG